MTRGNSPVTIYTLEDCPHCEILKEYLQEINIPYREEDMGSAGPLTELRLHGVFVREAPILRIGDKFFTTAELFIRGDVKKDAISTILSGEFQ